LLDVHVIFEKNSVYLLLFKDIVYFPA